MYQSAHNTYFEGRILSAGPIELVNMLYQGAMDAVQDARHHLANGQIAERSRAITKACAILMELSRSLDHNAGGELAGRLAALYNYMRRKLLEANFRKIDAPLGEVLSLLATLAEGWREIAKPREQAAPANSPWSQAEYPWGRESEPVYSTTSWSL
jgi:flagellar secretion chaperone FliS